MQRREFLELLAAAAAAGLPIASRDSLAAEGSGFYDVPRFGNVSLLHFTDCHAQLQPSYFREPNVNLGIAGAAGKPPHLVGDKLLKAFGIKAGSGEAHAFTYLDFARAARTYGKVGGFAHLATLVKQLKASRPGALLLDGGDTWHGSATALWSKGQDMVDAAKLLGVEVMTAHWEFTLGADRVKEVVDGDFRGKVDFLAQNISTADFNDPVFKPWVIREINGVPVGIVGQAFPYMPIANPRYFVADWTFGIKEPDLQKHVEDVRARGAQAVVLLSHNGMDVDLKLASRVTGIDAILGGHTHDGVPQPAAVKKGAPVPDISTPEALKRTLIAAKSVTYMDPERGTSGKHFDETVLPRLGVRDQVRAKARLGEGGYIAEKVAQGEVEIAFHNLTEILPVEGVTLVGLIPAELQRSTVYSGAVMKSAKNPREAQALLDYLASPAGRKAFLDRGFTAP